ncbi:PRD domain-containing protein [Enterococcus sp. BWM-S5]|uniref:PRD domain-containing protein n=1 Tax=Enterococcus larvae TaxID=2794352 RepID=A0ABS4CKN6_9ENTE|nr:PRD domain-containing protein [Enterococcus larvae]MBP1047038.1 PRD domain-containing protein [Enterococcus larvae]
MTICKSSNAPYSIFSATTLDKQTLIELLTALYSEQFPFRSGSLFEHTLQFALTEELSIEPTLTDQQMITIHPFFEEEYLFVRKALSILNSYADEPFTSSDFLLFLEIILCSNWQLSLAESELSRFIMGLDCFTKAICQQLGTSVDLLKKNQPDFLRHIQFLTFRILYNHDEQISKSSELYCFIQRRYPDAFAVTSKLRTIITNIFNVDLPDNEFAFLALHIEKNLNSCR